jgi:DNA primase
VEFREVLQNTKKILGLGNDWRPRKKKSLFGGVYENIARQNKELQLKVYDESVLNKYEKCSNLRFLRDNISIASQKFWDVRFSIEDNRIIIPIRNEYSEIVGAKGRLNGDADEENPKYLYTIPVAMSQLLYGYSENYQYLYGNDVILVESEKSVMQAWDFGVRNIVALGSHSLSEKQTKLLLQLQPKKIIIAMDEGLEFEHTKRNADMIKNFCGMLTPEIWYWDADQDLDIESKSSPTDIGRAKFDEIMEEQLVRIY